jgi:hypothetical protein
VFEPITDIAVLGGAPVAVLRYQARVSFDDGPGFTVWHTDCYRLRDGRWQVVWSQATQISAGSLSRDDRAADRPARSSVSRRSLVPGWAG